jgi:hypothetical protein
MPIWVRRCVFLSLRCVALAKPYIYIYKVENGNKYGEGETIYAQNDKKWVPDLRTRSSPPLKNTSYWTLFGLLLNILPIIPTSD